jgi:hypothetical protein
MSTLTVVLYNSDLSVAYKGSLALNFDPTSDVLLGGTLTLAGQQPVALTQATGQSMWSLTGSGSGVEVCASWMNSASWAENTTVIQSSVAGVMTLSVAGGAQQTLTIFGWDPAVFPWPPSGSTTAPKLGRSSPADRPAAAGATSNEAVAGPMPPPTQFNYDVTFIGQNTFNVGSGTIVATGQWYPLGPVGRVWRPSGTLTFTGGAACPFSGFGSVEYWYANAQAGFAYYDVTTVISQSGVDGGCTGALLINGSTGGIVFFVGTASS